MKNLSCFSCPSSSTKPNRLIWQDRPGENPQAPQGQTAEAEIAKMKNELFNNVVRPQESESAIREGGMSPEQFMEKYKNLLTTDFEAYKTGHMGFTSMGVEKFLKFTEVGYGYLESSNPEIVSEYVTSTLFELMMQYNQLTGEYEYQHPLYKDNPERQEKVKKDLLSFINSFVKEKAAKVWENNPVALAQTLAFLSEMKSTIPDAYQFLTTKVKSFELSDIQMRDVVGSVSSCRIGKERSEALPYVSRILYESKDKPLSNIVVFKETMDTAAWSDPKLFLFVLNRGKDIVRDPVAREYIENLLSRTEKVENKKIWADFLKKLNQ